MGPVSARVRRNRWIAAGAAALVVIAIVVIVLVAGGSGKNTPATAPLTGLPDPEGVANHRPAITVKVNNTDARPQAGIDQADVVYEEVVEGGYTRLAAIFNSHAPGKVGPVRSVRRTDQSIVWPVGGVFVYSGGAQYAIDSIDTAPVKQLDETRAGSMMFRDPTDPGAAPYNLWARVDQMFTAEKDAPPVPPPPLFVYRDPRDDIAAPTLSSFHVGFSAGFDVTWTWDSQKQVWVRTTHSPAAPDVDAGGVHIAAANVVVLFVHYQGGVGVEGSEAQLTGSGDALVFINGSEVKARWTRPDKDHGAKLTDADGKEIELTPGKTWVELPDVSYDVSVTPAA
jgi:hypothetical protein